MVTITSMRPCEREAACAKCGHVLITPEWSEFLNDHRVFDFWSCMKCGFCFSETRSTQRNSLKLPDKDRSASQ